MAVTFAPRYPKQVQFSETAVAVLVAGLTTVITVPVEGLEEVGFLVTNADAADAFDAFQVQFQYYPDGAYTAMASAGADFTTPTWPILKCSADPTTLAAAATSGMVVDVRGAYQMRIQASAAVNPSAATIQGCGR